MKKIIAILSVFIGIGLIVSIIYGFMSEVPATVPQTSAFVYKLMNGIQNFGRYIPGVAITGFTVSCSVHFGRNSEGSTERFSKAMLERFKTVMIVSIIVAFFLTFCSEVLVLLTGNKKSSIINRPKIVTEYINVGNRLFDNGYYERAMNYAEAALKLSPNEKHALNLRDRADVEINRARTSNIRFKLYESVEEAEKVDHVVIDAAQINEVYQLYLKANEAFTKKEWFNAHYYSELGIKLATPKDPNLEELKKISTAAWNNLTEYHDLAKTQGQLTFEKKYQGYLALVQKDDLKAYYIFRELYQSSREMQSDPDVVFYLQIAENRINERCFFIDETFELKSFESANDVYFAYEYADGSRDVIYFKGMTTVASTGNSIQYLRALTIVSVTRNGEVFRTMTVPYAKVLPVSVKTLTPTTKALMGIDDSIDCVPYIMLKSVGRDSPELHNEPLYTYQNGETANTPEYLLLSIPYDDFLLLEKSTSTPESMPLASLFKLVHMAAKYGFCTEVYGQALVNRIFYPLWILIMFILLAGFGWNNRINPTQFFKFSWALAFIPFILISILYNKMMMFLFRLVNYVLLGGFGLSGGMVAALVLYIILFICSAIIFVSRHSRI
ncbi:MAG: tetratricopeptide repeat protein [Treponema sp.]|nr:tetratricopeptide repeat protein [Treponema sp.]